MCWIWSYLVRQEQMIMLRPLGRLRTRRASAKHSLRRRIEENKIFVLIGNDDGVTHIGQDRMKDSGNLGSVIGRSPLKLLPSLSQHTLEFVLLACANLGARCTHSCLEWADSFPASVN